jgi:hypothetical protein
MELQELKDIRYYEIDVNTQQLIEKGFLFDGNTFSLSITAQINWSNLLNLQVQMFPLNVMDKYDNLYVLEYSNLHNFYYSALNGKNQYLQSGGVLKTQIKNAQTTEEVNLIIDNR